MIAKQSDVGSLWGRRMITLPIWLHHGQFASPICSQDFRTVSINHSPLTPMLNNLSSNALASGRNLQICFMNEAASDSESSDSETCPKLSQGMSRKKNGQRSSNLMNHRNASLNSNPYSSRPLSVAKSVMDPVDKGLWQVCHLRLWYSIQTIFSRTSRDTRFRSYLRSERQQLFHATSSPSNRSPNGLGTIEGHGAYADGGKSLMRLA